MARGELLDHNLTKHARFGTTALQHLNPLVDEAAAVDDGRRTSWAHRHAVLISGNPGSYQNDAPLREAKRSLDAADASGRHQPVERFLDQLQQLSPRELCQAKNGIDRLLQQSEVTSCLQSGLPQDRQVNAAVPQELVQQILAARKPSRSKTAAIKVVNQKRIRVRSTGRRLSKQPSRSPEKHVAFSLTRPNDALPTPESSDMSNAAPITTSASRGKQKAEDPRENPDNRHLFQFRVGDDEAFQKFCAASFNDLQQLAMKTILKAWVKELEPKKQKRFPYCQTYPYVDGQPDYKHNPEPGTYPDWWPINQVIHKEPDHLSKEDRSILAMTIIRYVMQLNSNEVDIDRLEESTRSQKLVYDKDKVDRPEHRRRVLAQLYDVARQRAMYENGETDDDTIISVSHLYKEPGRKRYRHKVKNQGTIELSPPIPAGSPVERFEGEDYKMNMTDEPPSVNFDQIGQPTPISLPDESIVHRPDIIFERPEAIHGFASKGVPESPFLGQPPFRPHQVENFPPNNSIYQHNYPERHVQQAPSGIQAFHVESNSLEWQQTANPSVISPVATQEAVNTSFTSTFDDMHTSWNSTPQITHLPFSSHPPPTPHEIASAPPMTVPMQGQTTRSYSVSEGMPIAVGGHIHHGYPPQSAVDGMIRPFDSSIAPDPIYAQQQQRHAFSPWHTTRPALQTHIQWPSDYMPPPNQQE